MRKRILRILVSRCDRTVLMKGKASSASMLCALGAGKKPVYAHLHTGKWFCLLEKGGSKGKGRALSILLPVVVKQPQRGKKKGNHEVERKNVIILTIPYRKKEKSICDKTGPADF